MPLYEYKCEKCKQQVEKIEKFDGPHLKKCPHCGGRMERMVSRSAIQFKGSGWYVTDYARSSSSSEKKSGESSGDSEKSSSKSEAKPAEKSTPAKEKKKTAGKEK